MTMFGVLIGLLFVILYCNHVGDSSSVEYGKNENRELLRDTKRSEFIKKNRDSLYHFQQASFQKNTVEITRNRKSRPGRPRYTLLLATSFALAIVTELISYLARSCSCCRREDDYYSEFDLEVIEPEGSNSEVFIVRSRTLVDTEAFKAESQSLTSDELKKLIVFHSKRALILVVKATSVLIVSFVFDYSAYPLIVTWCAFWYCLTKAIIDTFFIVRGFDYSLSFLIVKYALVDVLDSTTKRLATLTNILIIFCLLMVVRACGQW